MTPAKRAVAKRLEKDGIVRIDGEGEEKGVAITDAGELLIGEWNSEEEDECSSPPAEQAEERAREETEMKASRFSAAAIEADKLRAHIAALQAEVDVCRVMLTAVVKGCNHPGARRGYNERDGNWMERCRHCGVSE